MKSNKPAYAGNKRGPKVKQGYYHAIAIRVTDRATFDKLSLLSPEQRGAAIMQGAGLSEPQGGANE